MKHALIPRSAPSPNSRIRMHARTRNTLHLHASHSRGTLAAGQSRTRGLEVRAAVPRYGACADITMLGATPWACILAQARDQRKRACSFTPWHCVDERPGCKDDEVHDRTAKASARERDKRAATDRKCVRTRTADRTPGAPCRWLAHATHGLHEVSACLRHLLRRWVRRETEDELADRVGRS